MTTQLQDIQKKQIIDKYAKILSYSKKRLMAIVILCGSLYTVHISQSTIDVKQIQPLSVSEQKIISTIEKIQSQKIPKDIDTYIIQDLINRTGDYTISLRNLATYKGYILPQYFLLFDGINIPDIEYFENKEYDINKLQTVIQNLLLTFSEQKQQYTIQQIQDQSTGSIMQFFNLECIEQNIVRGPICQEFIDDMIVRLPVYNRDSRHEELGTLIHALANRLNNNKTKKLCNSILQYSLINKKNLNTFDTFVQNYCDAQDQEQFSLIKQFTQIEQELAKGFMSNYISNNKIINHFKLVSIQQSIYNDTSKGIFNTRKLESYIYYLQNILQHNNIDQFYIDSTYRFNNKFLVPQLSAQTTINPRIENILNSLRSINNGSTIVGFTGLKNIILNTGLALQSGQDSITTNNVNLTINDLLPQIINTSFFIPTQIQTGTENIYVTGYFNIITNIDNPTIQVFLQIALDNNRLIIKQAILDQFDEFTKVIQNIISSNRLSLAGLYQLINDNIAVYLSPDKAITLCDRIKENLQQGTITACSEGKVQIDRKVSGQTRTYRFTLSGFNIQDMIVSDSGLAQHINNTFTKLTSDSVRLPLLINEIVQFQQNNEQEQEQINAEKIRIIERVRNFLNITPQDLVQYNDTYYLQIRIKNITFVTAYDHINHIMSPLYFQDITIKGTPLIVPNFSLQLDAASVDMINSFLTDPLIYIKSINPSAYAQYQQFIKNNP